MNEDMFRPPRVKVFDRALFRRTIPLAAAKVKDRTQISPLRHALNNEMLTIERVQSVKNILERNGDIAKGVLLRPGIKSTG